MSLDQADLIKSIKKACSIEESAPKRKHVRACIVYTWDHKSSSAFFHAIKSLPFQNDPVQLFKALITIHKVLQEGHPSALTETMKNSDWLESVARVHNDMAGYGRLIQSYVGYLMYKLQFHRQHRGFNGTFEYEEYVSLVTVSDPNEGYEAILDLMNLQDRLDDFQRLIFSNVSHSSRDECKISALVPLVSESYGIYKFITSMIRAMHRQMGSDDALVPLAERYNSQHYRLFEFYADASSIRYLTSLITVPKLPQSPPDLFVDDVDEPQPKFQRPAEAPPRPASNPSPQPMASQPTGVDFWNTQQSQFEAEQKRLEQERQLQLQQQQQLAAQQQAYFEQQQQQQLEEQRRQQELLHQQQTANANNQAAMLQQDLLTLRNQYERDQLLLEQYDQRVKALEQEIVSTNQTATQQLTSKDEQINSMQEQINLWKNKYESLAKLYSQLRQEHLNLLNKFKKLQQKAASAQEAIDRREKLEKDLKSKNIELADLIRERDRARLDLDRLKGGKENEIDTLQIQVRELQRKLDETERMQATNLSGVFSQHKKEIDSLTAQLAQQNLDGSLAERLREKEEELEIVQQTMDEALKELAKSQHENDAAIDEQIDQVLVSHLEKLTSLVDAILHSGIKTIQNSLYELDSPMQAGNQNASPAYVLSVIENASNAATDFANSFNDFIADGPNGDHSSLISTVSVFTNSLYELLLDCKGLTRLVDDEESFIYAARSCAREAENFLEDLLSANLIGDEDSKLDTVINDNVDVQMKLQDLADVIELLAPTVVAHKGDLGTAVDNELSSAAQAIQYAAQHLNELLVKVDVEVDKAILAAAIAVTNAIAALIAAAVDCQNEIVSQGKGSQSRAAFYKKHNRWTEGLISAAKAVASSTKILITTADGVLANKNSHEELIVASNEVAASTAQLVAASRVKASFQSKTQDKLEYASKTVSTACKQLVSQVQGILSGRTMAAGKDVDYSQMSAYENKTAEMEQQVEILKLENALATARKQLGEIRKYGYRAEEEEE